MTGILLVWIMIGFSALLPVTSLRCDAGSANDPVLIEDNAMILSDAEEQTLYAEAEAVRQKTGFAVRIVTTDNTGGRSAARFLDDYMDARYTENMIACLIDMDNREIRLGTSGKAIYYLVDKRIDNILDKAFDKISSGDYSGCFSEMLEGTSYWYDRGIPKDQYTYDEDTGEIIPYKAPKGVNPLEGIISALGGVLTAFGIGGGVKRRYNMQNPPYKYNPDEHSNMNLRIKQDTCVGTHTTRRRIPRSSSSGGHSSGGHSSSVHHSSGGHSFGGGGRKF